MPAVIKSRTGTAEANTLLDLLRVAHAHLAARDATKALVCARQAVRIGPSSPDARLTLCMAKLALLSESGTSAQQAPLWAELALASLELHRVSDAIEAYTKAVDCGAGASAEAELAVLYAIRGEPLRAATALTGIVANYPRCAEARVHLATLLLEEGRAAAVLELLGAPPPPGAVGAMWRAQKSFAYLGLGQDGLAQAISPQKPRRDVSDLLVLTQHIRLHLRQGDSAAVTISADKLARLADDPVAGRLEHRIEAHFQLGGLFHGAKHAPRAMRHWVSGHRLLAAAQPFSRARHHALLHATASAFDAGRFGGTTSGNHDPAPVFIVGHPRTGTTLAEHILAAHPEVHGAGERLALLQMVHHAAGNTLDPGTPARAALLGTPALAALARDYLIALKAEASPGKTRVIDKLPANATQLGFAATLLPGARVIWCTRDRTETGFSIFRRKLSGYHPYAHDLGDLGWWMDAQDALLAHWTQVLPLPILRLRLDEWSSDFRGTLARVLAFLGLPYDSACEDFHLQERDVTTASRDQVRRPVTAPAHAEWLPYAAHLSPLIDATAARP